MIHGIVMSDAWLDPCSLRCPPWSAEKITVVSAGSDDTIRPTARSARRTAVRYASDIHPVLCPLTSTSGRWTNSRSTARLFTAPDATSSSPFEVIAQTSLPDPSQKYVNFCLPAITAVRRPKLRATLNSVGTGIGPFSFM